MQAEAALQQAKAGEVERLKARSELRDALLSVDVLTDEVRRPRSVCAAPVEWESHPVFLLRRRIAALSSWLGSATNHTWTGPWLLVCKLGRRVYIHALEC